MTNTPIVILQEFLHLFQPPDTDIFEQLFFSINIPSGNHVRSATLHLLDLQVVEGFDRFFDVVNNLFQCNVIDGSVFAHELDAGAIFRRALEAFRAPASAGFVRGYKNRAVEQQ
ncbi:hypothetical protein ScalyP_jg10521 [Parmales sp. scaly parma]|nr:hypothetical protein ScalyP_jg10521 [Parmales sp. scaly parma]